MKPNLFPSRELPPPRDVHGSVPPSTTNPRNLLKRLLRLNVPAHRRVALAHLVALTAVGVLLWDTRRWHLGEWAPFALIAGFAGLAVRFCPPGRPRAVLTSVGVVSAFGPMVETFGAEVEPLTVLDYLINLFPWFLFASLAWSSRRRLTYALGFFVGYFPFMPLLPLASFLVMRDLGRSDSRTPSRQHLALIATGLLAGIFARALTFDVSATLTYDLLDPPLWGGTRHLDATLPRWTRMATEAAIVASCFAQSRGRTWGVIGLIVLLPAFFLQLVISPDVPYWLSGCIGGVHPIMPESVYLWVALLAIGPWLWPMFRSLRTKSGRAHA